jgi:hypothetical protein
MNKIIKFEELGLMLLGIYLYSLLDYSWWLFLVLFFIPNISMIGYMAGNKIGAYIYNFIHHRGISILLYVVGGYIDCNLMQLVGIILFTHSTFDRLLGYGLKYKQGFKFTHLGEIKNSWKQ